MAVLQSGWILQYLSFIPCICKLGLKTNGWGFWLSPGSREKRKEALIKFANTSEHYTLGRERSGSIGKKIRLRNTFKLIEAQWNFSNDFKWFTLYKFRLQWYDLKKFLTMFNPRGVKRCITFLKQFQLEKKLCTSERPKHFCLMYSEQTSWILHGEMVSLSTTPTISMNSFKRGYIKPGFWRGSTETKL